MALLGIIIAGCTSQYQTPRSSNIFWSVNEVNGDDDAHQRCSGESIRVIFRSCGSCDFSEVKKKVGWAAQERGGALQWKWLWPLWPTPPVEWSLHANAELLNTDHLQLLNITSGTVCHDVIQAVTTREWTKLHWGRFSTRASVPPANWQCT